MIPRVEVIGSIGFVGFMGFVEFVGLIGFVGLRWGRLNGLKTWKYGRKQELSCSMCIAQPLTMATAATFPYGTKSVEQWFL